MRDPTGLASGTRANTPVMAPRDEVVLQVMFGPSKSPLASRAVSYARAHAKEAAEVSPGVWRASFRLGPDERTFGMASALLQMVLGWRSTTVEVEGSPEPPWVTRQMLHCAREWLRSTGACRAWFPTALGWPKCHACPLYDAGWAAESALPPVIPFLLEPEGWEGGLQIPDHLPEEWEDG